MSNAKQFGALSMLRGNVGGKDHSNAGRNAVLALLLDAKQCVARVCARVLQKKKKED